MAITMYLVNMYLVTVLLFLLLSGYQAHPGEALHGAACGYPGLPAGAVLHVAGEAEQFSVGTEVTYECEDGRVMAGEQQRHTRQCGEDGRWTGGQALCRENLSLGQPSLQSGTLLNYTPSMAVDGDMDTCSFTEANQDQRWWQTQIRDTVVESVAVAISPGSFQHFTIFVIELLEGNKALYKPCSSFKGTFDEAVAVFLCNGGEGHLGEFVYIRDDREEEEYFGLCEVQVFPLPAEETGECGIPEKPVGSVVTVKGGMASYSCEDGYVLVGERTQECTDGLWRGPVPCCAEVECPDPVSPTSGYIEVSNFKGLYQFGSVATYRCNTGFILWGNASRHCTADGSWVGSPPSCNPISCGNPPAVVNGLVELVNGTTNWQAVASYKCLPSFTNYGNENTTAVFSSCLPDGTWSLVTFTCMYDPRAVSKSNIGGLSLDWEAGSQMNISTMITIGVLSALIVLSLIVVIIVISHRKTSAVESARKISRSSTNQLIYDQVDKNDAEDSMGGCGVIVYDDLQTPHLVETGPRTLVSHYSSPRGDHHHLSEQPYSPTPTGSVVGVRSPHPADSRGDRSPRSERECGDGGSDKEMGHYAAVNQWVGDSEGGSDMDSGHYATVGRRMRLDGIYSSMRRPDGESEDDPYSSVMVRRELDEAHSDSDDQLYETLQRNENEKSVSSEASSTSQATVRLASTEYNRGHVGDLYARVDMNKKKKRNSDGSLSPTCDMMSPSHLGFSQNRLVFQTDNQPDNYEEYLICREDMSLARGRAALPKAVGECRATVLDGEGGQDM